MSGRGVATVAVDVADLCALHQTMRALDELVHAQPAEVDPYDAIRAARVLSQGMLRRLRDLQTGAVLRVHA